ncbi:bifunctional UDP-3-O-[3-hydroxymyristoyl] N-acetylglucosamine deacetylase/3-hydroxyacyl-ACP dehydratase [bacterium]|nr:bifunctional UDP-3-O-[3-hydroxymyristoyl] N-acetylglucosamine deacetylase/3-hydroxyacyl-ACP dehydratase [bacterium]MBU1982869.1 bifunctional UDP-3-O-[3-hydroxymyristoyl] N-acetylglucosamine deacetylase/3-hydroxyacyl-ACP dehydratase [bacterium]
MSERQKTIAGEISLTGIGLHTGHETQLTFRPAEPNTGIRFRRTDLSEIKEIPAVVENVVEISRGTVLGKDGARVHTVEHVLAAVTGLGIDNIIIELSSDEPPVMDGSAHPFVLALRQAGIAEQEPLRDYLDVEKTLSYRDEANGVDIVVVPSAELRITYMIDYPHPSVGTQYTSMYSLDEFVEEFSLARTFCLLSETEELKAKGLIQGGTLDNAVVFVDRQLTEADLQRFKRTFRYNGNVVLGEATLDNRPLRFRNEPVRHKTLDLIGDLALVGVPVRGHVLAARGGHTSHVEVARMLRKLYETQQLTRRFGSKGGRGYVFDSQAIEKLLPHAYPMLLVDRILELTPLEKVVGIKNVTRNEPFFDGHFPGQPIMPGVLIIECMGQTGGVLLLNSVEQPETKVVYFTGLDNVKFRKTVIPGDQIRFTVTMSLFRRGLCKMHGEAHVDGVLVAEADMTAVVMDREEQ